MLDFEVRIISADEMGKYLYNIYIIAAPSSKDARILALKKFIIEDSNPNNILSIECHLAEWEEEI